MLRYMPSAWQENPVVLLRNIFWLPFREFYLVIQLRIIFDIKLQFHLFCENQINWGFLEFVGWWHEW